MAHARYEYGEVSDIRHGVEERLEKLPAGKKKEETPEEFWLRVEQAGLLLEGIALYDQIAAEHAASRHIRRETKKDFEERIKRERRQAEAERLRAELVA